MASQLPPGTDLCAVPAAKPPQGQTSNLVDPPSIESAVIAVTTITMALAVIFTAGRLYNNIRKLNWADHFIIIAVVLSATYTGLILAMVKYSRHQWDTPACWFNGEYMKLLYAQGVLLGPVIFFAKTSIFLMYLNIFTIHRAMRLAIHFGLVFTFLLYWPGVPLESYYGAPHVGQTWEDLLQNGAPEHLIYWGLVQGTLSVVLDIYIFVLPIPVVSKLHLPTRKRVQVLAVFSTALMGIVASVAALVFRVSLLKPNDSTWAQACVFICVIVENNVAIIVSSMPFFASLMKVHVFGSFLRSLRSLLSSSANKIVSGTGDRLELSRPKAKFSGATLVPQRKEPYYELDEPVQWREETRPGGGQNMV